MRETLESILSLCSAALLGREDLPKQRREIDEPNGEAADMAVENGEPAMATERFARGPMRISGWPRPPISSRGRSRTVRCRTWCGVRSPGAG
jgi:hypothetical protein